MRHPTALVESEQIGEGTRIWAFAHVMAGARVGAYCNIGDHAFIERGAVVGDGVTIKNGVSIWEGVTLEDGVFVGPNAVFTNDPYPRSPRLKEVAARYADKRWLKPTHIKEGVTIGANATILCDVTIGAYAFIGAGAVITRDVPAHAMMVGMPARRRGWVCRCAYPVAYGKEGWTCVECGECYPLNYFRETKNFLREDDRRVYSVSRFKTAV